MSRCIAFLVYPGFQILDAAGPLAAFEAAGAFVPGAYRLVVLSRDGGLVASSGGIRLATEPAGRFARLVVEDNGPGFPAEILARAFEPYVTTKPKGTGLGLAIVRKIVDEHGGRIDITNKHENGTGGGAQISIRLPLANP